MKRHRLNAATVSIALVILAGGCGSDPQTAGDQGRSTASSTSSALESSSPSSRSQSQSSSSTPTPVTRAGSLPLVSIAARERPGEGPVDAQAFVVRQADDIIPFFGYLDEDDAGTVRGVDFTNQVAIVAFRALLDATGFPVTIRSVTFDGSTVHVVASMPRPEPAGISKPAASTAYDIVTIDRAAIGDAARPPEITLEFE